MTRHGRGQPQWQNLAAGWLSGWAVIPKGSRPGFEVHCILTSATKSDLFHKGKTLPCQQEHSILPVQNKTIILTVVQLYKPAPKPGALSAWSGYNLWVWICWNTRGGRNARIRFQGGGAVLQTPGDSPADRSAFNHSVLKTGCESSFAVLTFPASPHFFLPLPPVWIFERTSHSHKSLICIFNRQNS